MTNRAGDIPPRTRKGWWWKAPLLTVLFVVIGANVALRFIPVGPLLEGLLTKELGKPFVIGRLSARAFPGAYITAYDVRFGEGDFMATADRIVVSGSLWKLALKKIDLYHGEIFGFRVQLPPTLPEAVDRWNAMVDFIEGDKSPDDEEGDGWKLHIYHAEAADSRVYMADRLAMTGFVAVEEVTEPAKDFTASVRLAYFESNPALTGRAVLADRAEGDPTLTGTAALRGMRVNDLGLPASFPAGRLNLDVAMDGPVPENLRFAAAGALDVPEAAGLSGAFTANAWVQETRFLVNEMDFRGPGMTVRGDFTSGPEGAFACEVSDAVATGPGLTALFRLLSAKDAGFEARGAGQLAVNGLLFGREPGADLRFVSGEAVLEGIDYALPTGEVAFDGLEGRARVEDGRFLLDRITGQGVTVSGSIEPHFGGDGVSLDLAGEIALDPARLAPWVARDTLPSLSGALVVERFSGTLGGEGLPDDLEATAHLNDVSAVFLSGTARAPLEFDAVGGTVRYAGGVFELDGVGGKHFSVGGAVRPLDTGYALDLSGWADLNAGFVPLFLPDALSGLGGRITFARMAGAFGAEAPPDALIAEGKIENGRATLTTAGFTDEITDLNATFTTTAETVETAGTLQSGRLGPLEASVRYAVAEQALQADVSVDLAGVSGLLDGTAAGAGIAPVFQVFGHSTLNIQANLPEGAGKPWNVHLARAGDPAFEGSFAFDDGPWPAKGEARTSLPFGAFAALLPDTLAPGGEVALHFRMPGDGPAFSLDGDLTQASLAIGKHLNKPVQGPAGFTLHGTLAADGPALESAVLHAYGESLHVALAQGVRIDALELNLTPLEPLLPPGGMARGRVTGSLAMQPPAARLDLENVGLGFTETAKLDAVNGALTLDDGVFTCRDLRLDGADSDCTVNARWEGNAWEALAEGEKLNLDAVLALVNAATSTFGSDSTDEAGARPQESPAPSPPDVQGKMTVRMQQLFYQRGRLDQVRADVRVTPAEILIHDLSCVPYAGNVTGSIRIARNGTPPHVSTELQINDAEMRIVDETLFEQPRGLRGIGRGSVAADFAFGSADEVMNSMSGAVDLAMTSGSYGQLGAATRALSLLRVFEFIRLRIPTLGDAGLTYDESTIRLEADSGMVALRQFALKSASYEVSGEGTIDYPNDVMDVVFRVHLLEIITGLISRVPVLGTAVDAVTSVTDLVVTARGSAREPEFVVTPGAPPRRRNSAGR